MTELPNGWTWATLDEVCDRATKWDPRQYPERKFNYIDIGAIDGQRVRETTRLTGGDAPSRARQLVRAGDTILSTVRTYLRNTALVTEDLDGSTVSTGFCVLRPTKAVEPRFLFYRVLEDRFVEELSARQTGTSYPAVRDADVFERRIALPPRGEQRRIVAAIEEHLSRLDAGTASLNAGATRLKSMLEFAASRAVRVDWPVVQLGDVTAKQEYGTSAKAQPVGDVAILRMGNIRKGDIDLSELKYLPADHPDAQRFLLEPGDLLFNRTNSPELVGKSAVFRGADGPTAFASYLIRVRLRPQCDPDWAALVINGPIGRAYIAQVRTQQVGQANVNGTKLAAMPLPLPPIAEQRRLLREVREQTDLAQRLSSMIHIALRRARALRRAILARAFHGELVPQDPSDEPASVLLERIAAERTAARKPMRRRNAKARA